MESKPTYSIEEEGWVVVLPVLLSSAITRPVRECCWQAAGLSQRLSIITSLHLAPFCHMEAEKCLMRVGGVYCEKGRPYEVLHN